MIMNKSMVFVLPVDFGNDSLDKLPPVMRNGFIAQGLVAAFKPKFNLGGMVDLSGNGNELSVVGSPVFTSTGVIGDRANGFTSSITETSSITLLSISRTYHSQLGATPGEFNSRCLNGNFYYPAELNDGSRARGCYTQTAFTGTGSYAQRNDAHCAYIDIADDTQKIAVAGKTIPAGAVLPDDPEPLEWSVQVLAVDAAAERIAAYWPQIGEETILDPATRPAQIGPGSISNRDLANHLTNEPNYWALFCFPKNVSFVTGGLAGRKEIAAVALWNRALSSEEIAMQYRLLKEDLPALAL